ncbi:MAG: hypothetical protein HRU41_42075 [Saprospiraceae bacterium]|nr:hypothetical protein [Saprospiraceae bacterium]
MQMKKLLFIAYYAPPAQLTGNIRRYHLLKEFRIHFQQVLLLTSANGRLMRQDPSLEVDDLKIFSVPTIDLRRLYVLLKKKSQKSPTLSTRFKSSTTFLAFRKISESFPFNLLLDDGGCSYIWNAYYKAKALIKQQQIEYIFTSYRPTADLVVGMLLKREFPELTWIADFRDLPVDPIRKNTLFPKLQHSWYRHLLQRADLLTTVSYGLAHNLRAYSSKFHVLPNAVPLISAEVLPANTKFTITYTGSIYPKLQNGNLLFQAISLLQAQKIINPDTFQLVYAGKDSEAWTRWVRKHKVGQFSVDKGLIPYRSAIRLQQESHINWMLTWSSNNSQGILTAKSGNYLAARRPILALVNGPRDMELEDRISVSPSSLVLYTKERQVGRKLLAYLKQAIQAWQRGKPTEPQNTIQQDLYSSSWTHEVDKLLQHPALQPNDNVATPERVPVLLSSSPKPQPV